MKDVPPQPVVPGAQRFQLSDVYYTLFRHKWKIVLCSLAGFAGAAALYFSYEPLYESQAKLFIRYVVESESIEPGGTDPKIKSPDSRGENIINSELGILTSFDIAKEVADRIGPQSILGRPGGDTNEAALLIQRNLKVNVPRKSSIIEVAFRHRDPTIVQPVLSEIMNRYLLKHARMHTAAGLLDARPQADRLRSQLTDTENRLRELRTNAGVFSLEVSRKSVEEQLSRLKQEQLSAEAELAERQASFKELQKLAPGKSGSTNSEDIAPARLMAEYKRLSEHVEQLAKRDQELSIQFTDANILVKDTRAMLAAAEQQKRKWEAEHPELAARASAAAKTGEKVPDLLGEAARIAALQARIQTLAGQVQRITASAIALDALEGPMRELQLKRDLQETQYRYFTASSEQAHIDTRLGADAISNISKAQEPSPAAPADPSKLYQKAAASALGGVLLGIALAFLLDLYLNLSIKRAADVEDKLRMPVFLSIPYSNGQFRGGWFRRAKKLTETTGPNGTELVAGPTETAPWDPNHKLHEYWETLRDRLINYFEVREMTFKPKLVAVTGCGRRSGITTIATALAASLSETGEGNVLLVDMNQANGAAHPFYKGKPGCGLSDVLESGNRENALVQENLYMATTNSACNALAGILPKRFSSLIPKLRASDYDYVIFDMPPVTQTSITPRLANFMDVVLTVLEAERTDQNLARRACNLLTRSGGNVQVLLNKTRSYTPKRLQTEL